MDKTILPVSILAMQSDNTYMFAAGKSICTI